jgi:plastocyanin
MPTGDIMETEKTDQQKFDEQVNKTGKLVLQILAGVGIFAALMMSIVALIVSSDRMDSSPASSDVSAAAKARQTAPTSASATIDHVTRGCHVLTVNNGAQTTNATIHLAAGGSLRVQDNDVMPHQIVRVAGPQAQFVGAAMTHMGARSTVTFPTPGTYSLTTKAGEDYMKGIQTLGPDNTLRIKVIVSAA